MQYTQPLGNPDPNASYINGNPATGVEGSAIPAAALEPPQREIVAVITAAGLSPSSSNNAQLLAAIQALSGGVPIVNATGTNFTYSNTDAGQQVNRSNSGTAMFDTLPGTPGQINATGVINIFNADASALLVVTTGAGAVLKGALSYNGFLILGPGQSANIISDGTNYWIVAKPDRIVLGANSTIFVSTAGSDTANSGLTSGSSFASMQQAWNVLTDHFDLNGFVMTVQLANGTYTAGLSAQAPVLGMRGSSSIVFQGSTAPSNVVISMTGANCFEASGGASFTVQGMTLTGTGGSSGLNAQANGTINFSNASYPVAFGAMGTGNHLLVEGGNISALANYSISGGAAFHANSANGGNISLNGVTVTLTGTPAITIFASATVLAALFAQGATFTGSATGTRYSATVNGVIDTNGAGANFFPGNAAGVTATGGQYA